MTLIVQKFGGTSVATLDCIRRVSDHIIAAVEQGHQVVVVVSAMAGETDRLIGLAKLITPMPNEREYAALVSTGEQVSMSLLAITLNNRGYSTRSYSGWQAGIVTDESYTKARIQRIDHSKVQQELNGGHVVVVAGFQGINERDEITTLGRGGSDTSAVALAVSLQAAKCQIFTDVDGVYTTDPRLVQEARRLDAITFEEMLEMASLGAKVLQIRAVEYANRFNMPIHVLSTFEEGPGTLIISEETMQEKPLISGIAFNRNEAKITIVGIQDQPGFAAKILGPISEANIDVDMVIKNTGNDGVTDFTFTVHREDYEKTLKVLDYNMPSLKAKKIVTNTKIAKLSLVGVGMKSHAGIASKMFRILGEEGINIQLISTSEIKISVVIDEKYLELGVRSLHSGFGLSQSAQEDFDPKPMAAEGMKRPILATESG